MINIECNLRKDGTYRAVNLSALCVDELCFDIFENTITEDDFPIIEEILTEVINLFGNTVDTFYYSKYEEIFTWPKFFILMKFIYSVFEKHKLSHKLEFIDNNTSFKFKNNIWNYKGLPIMLGKDIESETFNIDEYADNKVFKKTFLSLNGRPKKHREDLIYFLKDKNLLDKCYYSFGTSFGDNETHPLYKQLDIHINHSVDGIGLKLSSYEKHSFCYLVTENSYGFQDTTDDLYLDSLIEPQPNLFSHLTEKITRGIGTMMPFIVIGQPYTLKILKQLGFKTFNKWWNESYDLEEDYEIRMDLIKSIILDISKWDMDRCKSIHNEMLPILYHNIKLYNYLKTNLYNLYSDIDTFTFISKNEVKYKKCFNKKYSLI